MTTRGITLLVLEVGCVGLRNEDVQVSPPDGRRAGDEFQVVGLEEDDVDGAHELGGGAYDAIHPERLLERGRAQRGGRRRLNVKLDLDRQVVLPRHPEHLYVASRLGDVPIDEFAVVRRPGRFRDCEEVRRLEQVALAVTVLALKDAQAGLQGQFGGGVVAESREGEP